MVKSTALFLVAAQIMFCFSMAWSQEKNLITMKIIQCSGPNLVTDKGTDHGVIQDMAFSIIKLKDGKESVVGTAKVRVIRNNKSGLKIIALNTDATVQVGDLLRELDDSQEILSSLKETESSPVQNMDNKSTLQDAEKGNSKTDKTTPDDAYVKSLENKIHEKDKKDSHTNGILVGAGVCCGIYLIASLFYAAGQDK